jgi:uncharacterized protein YlxW (UPF0749 family)
MADPDRPLPPHVTTPLLTLVTQQALEEDYRQVAERRTAGAEPPGRDPVRVRMATVGVVVAFGLLVSLAAVQYSRSAASEDAGRATLIARIEQERGTLQIRQDRVADLGRENQRLADQLAELTAARQQAEAELRRLEAVTGYLPVTGEGVRIVVEGNPAGGERQQVTDVDLAWLVDGLFEAGAEAIAINDQRLNALGAIRNAGAAIHVNTRPLTAPYVVRAIGDRDTLQADLVNTTHGAQFFSLADQLGFVVSMQNEDELSLPAAGRRPLRHVSKLGAGGSPPTIEEGSP